MSNSTPSTYEHVQKGAWHFVLYAMAALFLTLGWLLRQERILAWTFPSVGLLMFVLGNSFQHLTVVDEGRQLAIRFGPFPLFRRRIWYDDICDVEQGRLTILDGWGIHISLRGGWVWNIWGLDCVVVRLRRGTLRIGTDDGAALTQFLKDRIPAEK